MGWGGDQFDPPLQKNLLSKIPALLGLRMASLDTLLLCSMGQHA